MRHVICRVILYSIILPKHQRMYDIFCRYCEYAIRFVTVIVRSNQDLFPEVGSYSCYVVYETIKYSIPKERNSTLPNENN